MPSKTPFRVVHVSGQDDSYKATELNSHSPTTKGWQSSRFCLYPQDIVVQLDSRVRLRKIQLLSHQFLIATKIEFYVGDVPDQTPVSLQNARYTRLGYVALSDNDKTGFKARELKSVHVDAVGLYVKFVIHKNHINKHNLYNQVGLVALNVIGDDITNPTNYPHLDDRMNDPALAGLFNRPDYISPLDDLAFDMYQDPEVAQIIRKLERKKQDAVLEERYDFAKRLKNVIQELQRVGEKLGKYEVEKRQAVENEDYDKASLKKVQMDEYRLQMYQKLELSDLLEVPDSKPDEAPRQRTPPRLTELPASTPPPSHRPSPPPRTPYEDRPLPAIKKVIEHNDTSTSVTGLVEENQAEKENLKTSSRSFKADALPPTEGSPTPRSEAPKSTGEDRPIPSLSVGQDEDINTEDASGNVTGEPEPMSEKDQREAAGVIDLFGLPLVSKAYSKTWSFREDALLEVYKQLSEMPAGTPKDEAKVTMRGAVYLATRALKDKVFAVYTAALNLLKMILTEFVPTHRIHKSDTSYAVERTLPYLIQRTSDTAARNRDSAKAFILEESTFPEVKTLSIIPNECVKPFKPNAAPRLALSRTEILEALYKEHGLEKDGLTVQSMMGFCVPALQHHSGEVREKAELIIIALYKEAGANVKDYLPPDDEKTRKNVLYKKMFEAFDKIDGKPSKQEQVKRKREEEKQKQREIEALQKQLQDLRDMQAGKKAVDPNVIKDEQPNTGRKGPGKKKDNKVQPDNAPGFDPETASQLQIDHTCIFCGEKNEAFSEEGLDLHYWKSCPMLKRCSFCKQVVEIASYTDHLLTECDAKDQHKKDPRCSEAIPVTDYEAHIRDKSCLPAEAGKNHCPLCHLNFSSGEEGWKNHLMGPNGCKQNPRRLNKGSKAQPAKGRAGKIPQPTKATGRTK